MKFTLGLAQTCHPKDGDVVGMVRAWSAKAQKAGVDILVFPEQLMSRYEQDTESFVSQAQEVGGSFSQALAVIAREFGLWILYTINESNSAGLPFNSALLLDAQGELRGLYRKVHLFDSAGVKESSRMSAGNASFCPIQTPFCTIGMAICYDLRFPELARTAALAGCELMLYPAAWVDGPDKAMQWQLLIRARALENQMFVAGVCRADKGYIGCSCVAGPRGDLKIKADNEECLLSVCIDTQELIEERRHMPVLKHRREDVYDLC